MELNLATVMALLGSVLSVLAFIRTGASAAKKDNAEWGELKSDIKYIKSDIAEIKDANRDSITEMKASIKNIYARMDEKFRAHEQMYHQGGAHGQ
jgi:hypothetical protein